MERTLNDIRSELDDAIAKRAELWDDLSEGHDAVKAAEAARLSQEIDELWAEHRAARAHARFGPSDIIIARARAEERLDRESRRLRRAA
jgi:hypothetical protein